MTTTGTKAIIATRINETSLPTETKLKQKKKITSIEKAKTTTTTKQLQQQEE